MSGARGVKARAAAGVVLAPVVSAPGRAQLSDEDRALALKPSTA
jgi:hypothetical protein